MNIIEITNAYDSAEEARTDWSIVTEEADGIAQRAARKAADSYPAVLEYEDAYQEALILLATRPGQARAALDMGPGTLHKWLTQRLRDAFLASEKRRSKQVSFEANLEALGEAV
ncbi:hypothetical protein ABZ960_20255 [Streptomyces pseudovenezuelae]|uniref:hypothetical protein n=1 Tax=Streptomyces pseudovenezuelae TaxID=67350 RepID=UPI0034A305A4